MTTELRKFVAPEIVFGLDARRLVGVHARNLGARRALVVSDSGVCKAGWTTDVVARLSEEQISHHLYTAVTPNPRDSEVMEGAEIYAREGCDIIVAVGGGSVIDCAKALGAVSTNGCNVLEFEGVDNVPVPMPPIICIPTTGGTSADVSQFAIISTPEQKRKIAIISKAVVPDVALVDPRTLVTMGPFLTGCTGMDALVHALEAYVSNASSPLTDLHALEAIRLLATHLRSSVEEGTNLEARSGVMLASLQAGLAFSNASLGAVHALAHSLGGVLDLPHGECNAMLLPHVVAYNYSAVPERMEAIAGALGVDVRGLSLDEAKRALFETLQGLRQSTGTSATLGKRGVARTDIPALAERALVDACIATNPRRPTVGDLEAILGEAL